jgi:hypothetical protein
MPVFFRALIQRHFAIDRASLRFAAPIHALGPKTSVILSEVLSSRAGHDTGQWFTNLARSLAIEWSGNGQKEDTIMHNSRELLGYILAAALVVGGVMLFAMPASAESYHEVTVKDKDWTSDPPYHWSITAPTVITESAQKYEVSPGTVWKREGRRMVRMSPVEVERRQNVKAQMLIKHEKLWPEPSVH